MYMQMIACYRAFETDALANAERVTRVPIVALTALYTTALEDQLVARGFHACYPKPLSSNDIDEIISEHLQH
jgi:BarA-like signal transduction histidine kinase